jgi:Deoxyribodipyrimidine photolyase
MHIFWHQRDLRTRDNLGLAVAARDETVLPVYVYDTEVLEHVGRRQRSLMMGGVRKLKERYRELGSDLIVRGGDSADVLASLCAEHDVETVYYNDHYRPARRQAQQRVEEQLTADGVTTDSRTDLVLVDPERLESSYPNHSQFHSDWENVPKATPYDEPDEDALAEIQDGKTVPIPEVDIELPAAGYKAARERFDDFLDTGILSYNDTRDDLPKAVTDPTAAVSRLSPYLATGMIGIRDVWAGASESTTPSADRSVVTSTNIGTSFPGASRTITCCTTIRTLDGKTTSTFPTRSHGGTMKTILRRGKPARPATRSSTPGCGSSTERGIFTTAHARL